MKYNFIKHVNQKVTQMARKVKGAKYGGKH